MINSTETLFVSEPFEIYRAKAKENLSSHQLADFRKCPELYFKKKVGLIEDEDRPAYEMGRAVHTMVLEGGDVFDRTYAVGGPINPKTQKPYGSTSQKFLDWAAQQGKPVLSQDIFEQVTLIASSVRKHPEASRLLSQGIPEGVLRCNYEDVPSQVRLDFFNFDEGIVDLKTCDDLSYFEADSRRFGYANQMAFYRAIVRRVTGKTYPVHFIAVEKKEPYRCGVWLVSEASLNHCEIENLGALFRLKECLAADTWPTGYEAVRTFDH